MADFRLFDAEGRITLNDRDLDRGLRGAKRKVQRTMAEIRAMRAEAEIRADISDVEKKAKAAQREIRSIDRARANVKVGADKSEFDRKMAEAKAEADALDGRKIELKIELDQRNAAIREVSRQFRDMRRDGQQADNMLSRMFQSLSTLTVRVGPFTASLKQLGIALTLLAPLILGVVGAIGALTASVASGALGALAVGGAALAGFGLSALGVGLIMKPLVTDLQNAFKAQKAYNDAVSKYGKGSSQAKTAAEKLDHVLAGTSKETREQFKQLGKLSSEWGRLTKSARPAFFETLGQGIKTARALMPTFARESTKTFKTAAAGVQDWLKGLRSPEAKNILGNVMSRFRAGLGPAMRGIGSLATGLARIGNSASRYLEPAGKALEKFGAGFATQKGVDAKVDRWVTSLKAVARFAKAAVQAITALGRAATGAGNDLLGSMSAGLEKWTEWANTAQGQQSIADWFAGAVDTVKDLGQALGPLIKFFITWADAVRPISDAMLEVVTALGKLINLLSKIPGFQQAVTVLFAAFAASRIVAATRALAEFVGLLRVAGGLSAGGALGGMFGGRGGRGPGGGGFFPLFGGRGGKGGKFKTPFVIDDGAVVKDAERAAGKWRGRAFAVLKRGGRVAGPASAALTIASMFIPGTGEGGGSLDTETSRKLDQHLSLVEQKIQRRHWKKQNLKLSNLLGITQDKAAGLGDNILRPLQDQLAKAGDGAKIGLDRLRRRIQNTLNSLTKTKGGAKLVLDVATRGDKQVQATFRALAAHKFGRKLLDIVARGGPQARKWLFDISRTKLGQKLMRIIQKGGPEARSLLRGLSSAKLRDKVLKIIEKGGPNVEKRLERILGIDLGSKKISVSEIGAMPTLGKLETLRGFKIGDKTTHVNANVGEAMARIGGVKSAISSIPSVKNVVINVSANVAAGARKFTGRRAAGGELREDPMDKALQAALAPEHTKGGVYASPKFLVGDHVGGPAEVVISPDPAVRESNIAYWKRAARMLNIPGFAEGYGGASSPEGYSKALERLTGPRSQIERKKAAIGQAEKNFEQKERGFNTGFDESTFLNADGSVNSSAIKARANQLQELINFKQIIQGLWNELITIIDEALHQVRQFIAQITRGLRQMPDMVKRHEGHKKVWKPNERKKKLAEVQDTLRDAIPGLQDEKAAAVDGYQDIQLDINDLAANKFAVLGTKPETTETERFQAGLEAALAVAGTTPGTQDDKDATQALINFHTRQLAAAQAMLTDNDPTNDYTANQLIAQHSGALKGYMDDAAGGGGSGGGGAGSDTGILGEMASLSSARSDLYRQYGGNAAPMGPGGAGKVVNVTNNYQTQPVDPHTWTAQLQWELEAVI